MTVIPIWHIAKENSDEPLCGDSEGLALGDLVNIDDADYRGILCQECRAQLAGEPCRTRRDS